MNQSESVRSPKQKEKQNKNRNETNTIIYWQQITGVMRNKTDTKTELAKR